MTQTNSNLIKQFLADTLNREQKKEFVKRLTSFSFFICLTFLCQAISG